MKHISEMVSFWFGGLRNAIRVVSGSFFGPAPAFDKTRVDYDMARQLYRNDSGESQLGAGFCKPIIDRAVEFIGIPHVTSDDDANNALVNEAIDRHWKPQLQEIFRNSMRDSLCYVRVWQPLLSDVLTTEEERQACALTIYEPERITVTIDPRNPKSFTQAVIVTKVEFPDEVEPRPDLPRGTKPKVKEHEIWEYITPTRYTYYDRTDHVWLDDWARDNKYEFVPIVAVHNEFDSSLSGGQSDLESVYPFVKALHEVMRQALQSHKYHSMPKLRFKVTDIASFLRSNFPTTVDEEGEPIPGAVIPWQGREVLFIGEDEDIDFLQIDSILGDSKELMEFLIDCISVASETPEEMFMRNASGAAASGDNKFVAFEKKIERKRNMFQEHIQMIVKMMLKINGRTPDRMDVLWSEISVDSLVTLTQSMQQFVMALEVLLERKLISESTAQAALRVFRVFKTMKAPAQESADAADNLSLEERTAKLDQQTIKLQAELTPAPVIAGTNGNTRTKKKQPATSGKNGGGKNE